MAWKVETIQLLLWHVYKHGIWEAIGADADDDLPEREDARLIAAAPEMLEALEEAARWLDNDGDYTLNDTLCETKYDCVRVILAAIAKAKGE